jgi:GTP-binding protein
MRKPIVAIVGRPNVGKSTLFNRILGERKAIVDDQPGVTRDRHYGESDWAGREFVLIDTGGYVPDSSDVFEKAIREQVQMSLTEADVVVFVVDAREGITPLDEDIAKLVRKHARQVVLAVNKIDSGKLESEMYQFHALGLGDPHPVSAISGRTTGDLLDLIVADFPEPVESGEEEPFKLAIVGRPNVGKSSITNALLGAERSIVTDIPGTTRDSIDSTLKFHGREITIIDTAGLRRRSKVHENIEFFSSLRTMKSLQRCDVALVLIDATLPISHQDIDIISEAAERHKGLVVAVNKWDLVEKDSKTAAKFERDIYERIKMFDYAPIIFVSALTKQRVVKLLELCIQVHEERQRRIPTAELNDALLDVVHNTPPPATPTGREVKVYYVTQVREQPPVIVLFTNEPKYIPESYRRFVERSIRARFGFAGVPLTVQFRARRS